MTTTKIIFKNSYNTIGRKTEFKTKINNEDLTDQSQYCSASIVEMAKRFGIDAIIAKAEKREIEVTGGLADKLYGNDFTKMFKSKEEMLNVKKKIGNLFENIPARIRKETFNDNPAEFIDAYVTNDENKLKRLNEIGIISNTQLHAAKDFNAKIKNEQKENENRKLFIQKLEEQKGLLYENFKKNGDINFNINKDIPSNSNNV